MLPLVVNKPNVGKASVYIFISDLLNKLGSMIVETNVLVLLP